jgi:hypothetical protein
VSGSNTIPRGYTPTPKQRYGQSQFTDRLPASDVRLWRSWCVVSPSIHGDTAAAGSARTPRRGATRTSSSSGGGLHPADDDDLAAAPGAVPHGHASEAAALQA